MMNTSRTFGAGLGARAVFYGLAETAQVRAEQIVELDGDGLSFTAVAGGARAEVQLHLLGRHNVHNALAAIAVGLSAGMTLPECALALGQLRAPDKRGVVIAWRGARLINDCYNSNPVALDAMVDALAAMAPGPGGRRIVVAGEMLELGPAGEALHRAAGEHMAARAIDVVIGVRGLAEALVEGAAARGVKEAFFVATPADAGAWLSGNLGEGDVVLLKASRGVRLEDALKALEPDAVR